MLYHQLQFFNCIYHDPLEGQEAQKLNKNKQTQQNQLANHCDCVPPLAMLQLLWQQLHVPNLQPRALHVMLGHESSVNKWPESQMMNALFWMYQWIYINRAKQQSPKNFRSMLGASPLQKQRYRNWDDVTTIHLNVIVWDILSRRSEVSQENQQSFIFRPEKKETKFIVGGTPRIMLIMKTIHLGKLAQQFLNLHGDSSIELPDFGCFLRVLDQ